MFSNYLGYKCLECGEEITIDIFDEDNKEPLDYCEYCQFRLNKIKELA